jgi:hypothetical protein
MQTPAPPPNSKQMSPLRQSVPVVQRGCVPAEQLAAQVDPVRFPQQSSPDGQPVAPLHMNDDPPASVQAPMAVHDRVMPAPPPKCTQHTWVAGSQEDVPHAMGAGPSLPESVAPELDPLPELEPLLPPELELLLEAVSAPESAPPELEPLLDPDPLSAPLLLPEPELLPELDPLLAEPSPASLSVEAPSSPASLLVDVASSLASPLASCVEPSVEASPAPPSPPLEESPVVESLAPSSPLSSAEASPPEELAVAPSPAESFGASTDPSTSGPVTLVEPPHATANMHDTARTLLRNRTRRLPGKEGRKRPAP